MLKPFADKVDFVCLDDTEQLIKQMIIQIKAAIARAIEKRSGFTLAVSGGSSPKPLFKALAQEQEIPWKNGAVTLVDERCVPPDHGDSNERLIRDNLLTHSAAKAGFLGLYRQDQTPQACIDELNSDPGLKSIDIAILGMGMDGHTASLFPCSPELADNLETHDRYVIATPQTAPRTRISLSANAIVGIPELWLFLPGQEKLDRFNKILTGEDPRSPLKTILERRALPLKVFSSP